MSTKSESRLPQWAQDELASLRLRLRQDVEHWKRKAFEACLPEPGRTNTYVNDPMSDARHGLPSGTRVRFEVGKTDRDWIDVYVQDGKLMIMAGDCISIDPRASNTVTIRTVKP